MDILSRIEELVNEENRKEVERLLDDLRNYTLILDEDLEKLEDDSYFLNCLDMAGVDNWDGYGEAQSMMYNNE